MPRKTPCRRKTPRRKTPLKPAHLSSSVVVREVVRTHEPTTTNTMVHAQMRELQELRELNKGLEKQIFQNAGHLQRMEQRIANISGRVQDTTSV